VVSMFMYTEFGSAWLVGASQTFEDSGCISYFPRKHLNSTPQVLSSIDCSGSDPGFQISPKIKPRGFKSGERAGQKTETLQIPLTECISRRRIVWNRCTD
jgi:hypothetical protein